MKSDKATNYNRNLGQLQHFFTLAAVESIIALDESRIGKEHVESFLIYCFSELACEHFGIQEKKAMGLIIPTRESLYAMGEYTLVFSKRVQGLPLIFKKIMEAVKYKNMAASADQTVVIKKVSEIVRKFDGRFLDEVIQHYSHPEMELPGSSGSKRLKSDIDEANAIYKTLMGFVYQEVYEPGIHR